MMKWDTGLVVGALALLVVSGLSPYPYFVEASADFGLDLGDSAACWADLDNDGFSDLVAGGAVWMNKGGTRFQRTAAVGSSVAADYNNDGFVDLFSWSEMKLYRNLNGEGFYEASLPALPKTVSRGACWGDFNGDGFVDLFVGGYEEWDPPTSYPDMLLMNRSGRAFELVWSSTKNRARGVTACDFDGDGDIDVYVSNYRLQPNALMVNDGKGGLTDQATARNALATSSGFDGGHSIGSAWGDFDGDGLFDLFAGNFAHVDARGDQPKSRFLRNLGSGNGFRFDDLGTCGVFYQESYASPAVADYDNDGDLDLYFTTVYATASFNRKNYPVLFRNQGSFAFDDATIGAGLADIGATYQAAWADFDRDGDLDLVTNGKLFVSRVPHMNWLEVQLVGDGRTVNRSAIGAQVLVQAAGKTLVRQVEAGTGEGNQNDLVLHFGLGSHTGPVSLDITWPGGRKQRLENVKVGQVLRVAFR